MTEGRNGPGAGTIIAGVALILFGLCILLVGGGCTIFLIVMMTEGSSGDVGDGGMMLLTSIVAAAAGLFAIVKGVQMFRRRPD